MRGSQREDHKAILLACVSLLKNNGKQTQVMRKGDAKISNEKNRICIFLTMLHLQFNIHFHVKLLNVLQRKTTCITVSNATSYIKTLYPLQHSELSRDHLLKHVFVIFHSLSTALLQR